MKNGIDSIMASDRFIGSGRVTLAVLVLPGAGAWLLGADPLRVVGVALIAAPVVFLLAYSYPG